MVSLICHPSGDKRLGDFLKENFLEKKWTLFRMAVAFVKTSGVKHIKEPLKNFLKHGDAKVSVGIDQAGTSREGVTELLAALGDKGKAWIFHNDVQATFHPKMFLFSNDSNAECFIGSGNLTEGGLFTNYEAIVHLQFDKSLADDAKFLEMLNAILDEWIDTSKGTALRLTPALIKKLSDSGDLPTEAQIRNTSEKAKTELKGSSAKSEAKKLFAAVKIKSAPKVARTQKPGAPAKPKKQPAAIGTGFASPHGFVMTLQQTDAGVGQKTKGTSKRSPEIFIPLAARDADPRFWGWRTLFKEDPTKSGKFDRVGVPMRLGGQIVEVNMMTWPDKSDFRLRNAALRDAGMVGDVLRMEQAGGKAGYDYYVEIVPPGSSEYEKYYSLCTEAVRNSKKKWGYY